MDIIIIICLRASEFSSREVKLTLIDIFISLDPNSTPPIVRKIMTSTIYEIFITSTSPDVMVDKEEDFVLMNLVVIAFGNFIRKDNSFYDVTKKEQIIEFLNAKIKSYDADQIYQ